MDEHYQPSLWIKSAYGSQAAYLDEIEFEASLFAELIANFYQQLKSIPEAATILHHLSEKEFIHLQQEQTKYLQKTLSSATSFEQHTEMAFIAGLRHFYVGLSMDLLNESIGLYFETIVPLINQCPHSEKIQSIVIRRLQHDLTVQSKAYTQAESTRLITYQYIQDLPIHVYQDPHFLSRSFEYLVNSFNQEITGISVGQFHAHQYQSFHTFGQIPHQHAHLLYDSVELHQAWLNEESLFIHNLHQSCILPEPYIAECHLSGIRSIALFLMYDQHGIPHGILTVYSQYPGYFNEKTIHYWQELADLLCNKFFITPPHSDTNTPSHAEKDNGSSINRRYFRQLLSQEKVALFYQPIISPSNGQTVKVEALARLYDGDQLISPAQFLPSFGTNQLRDLFEIGIEQIAEGINRQYIKCSINLPTEVMADNSWFKALPNKLEQLGIEPHTLSLEILESSLTDNPEIIKILFTLKEAGYDILLDDVGAGESSLIRLANLPVSGIKIDRNFIHSLQYSFENLDFILSLRSLALQRGLECIVEGVETTNIMDALGYMHDVFQQGYLFSKPLPYPELLQWFRREEEGQSYGPFPQTLFGWYGRHIERFLSTRQALASIPDLLDADKIDNAEMCPLHAVIPDIGGDGEIIKAHYHWHKEFARFTRLRQKGESMRSLWPAMESNKYELRQLIEKKLHMKKS